MSRPCIFLTGALTALITLPAYAHHPTGGAVPDSVLYGVLSGIGHPLIDLVHLVFILAVGLLFALQPGPVTGRVLLFLATTWIGALVHLFGLDIPALEEVMALGVIVAGLMLAWKQLAVLPGVVALAGIAGLFHGFAYAEAIIGARTGPLLGYFFGFTLIQGMLLLGTVTVVRKLIRVYSADVRRRGELLSGAVVAGLGVVLLAM